MNNMWLDFLMKEHKPLCNTNANSISCFPAELYTAVVST